MNIEIKLATDYHLPNINGYKYEEESYVEAINNFMKSPVRALTKSMQGDTMANDAIKFCSVSISDIAGDIKDIDLDKGVVTVNMNEEDLPLLGMRPYAGARMIVEKNDDGTYEVLRIISFDLVSRCNWM